MHLLNAPITAKLHENGHFRYGIILEKIEMGLKEWIFRKILVNNFLANNFILDTDELIKNFVKVKIIDYRNSVSVFEIVACY